MELRTQTIEEILDSLSPLESSWEDNLSIKVINKLQELPEKPVYSAEDVVALLQDDFEAGLLACRLFLGLSDDELQGSLRRALGKGGAGVTRFQADQKRFLDVLISLGLLDAIAAQVNRKAVWSDVLVERLRSSRGKAIRGQRRGRNLENFVEEIVRSVFGDRFETRCSFSGATQALAKCDFAIPSREAPRIIIESKGYGATGSKMSDVIGDLNAIIRCKRHDTAFIFVTDGLTWTDRKNDLRKIVRMQNTGEITRIYTTSMEQVFREDLETLKQEYRL